MWINKIFKDQILFYMPRNPAVLPFSKQKIICAKKTVHDLFLKFFLIIASFQ